MSYLFILSLFNFVTQFFTFKSCALYKSKLAHNIFQKIKKAEQPQPFRIKCILCDVMLTRRMRLSTSRHNL